MGPAGLMANQPEGWPSPSAPGSAPTWEPASSGAFQPGVSTAWAAASSAAPGSGWSGSAMGGAGALGAWPAAPRARTPGRPTRVCAPRRGPKSPPRRPCSSSPPGGRPKPADAPNSGPRGGAATKAGPAHDPGQLRPELRALPWLLRGDREPHLTSARLLLGHLPSPSLPLFLRERQAEMTPRAVAGGAVSVQPVWAPRWEPRALSRQEVVPAPSRAEKGQKGCLATRPPRPVPALLGLSQGEWPYSSQEGVLGTRQLSASLAEEVVRPQTHGENLELFWFLNFPDRTPNPLSHPPRLNVTRGELVRRPDTSAFQEFWLPGLSGAERGAALFPNTRAPPARPTPRYCPLRRRPGAAPASSRGPPS